MRTFAYGPAPDQVADLYLPARGNAPVVCLVHGGFWRLRYGRDTLHAVALDVTRRGFAVWNLEYRRVGSPGGGWPGTLQDVAAGIARLSTLALDGDPIDARAVTVVGHSAGGQLALWAARGESGITGPRITAAIGLAPVADLRLAYELQLSDGAVQSFMGGAPDACAERYRDASPAERLPLRVRQLLVHGSCDADVPIEISRHYAAAARAAGDDVTFIELATAQHMDFLDPQSAAHATWCRWLTLKA